MKLRKFVGVLLGAAAVAAGATPLKLHVPSPDWRDQIIYFVLTDRFANGRPGNDDQRAGEFRAGDNSFYNGGDLQGLIERLDYIRGLGATALWITPPVANQWWDPLTRFTGFHGYWAEDFTRVDPHLGTLGDYQRLSDRLHRAGMSLVQDIVVNHTGNYFAYHGGWDAGDPAKFYSANVGARPHPKPTQPPFHLNDPRDPRGRRAGIFHWTPDVSDYGKAEQLQNWQMAGLDDLNTDNPVVRRALRRSYGDWIRLVGVDAFRVDTALYVQPDFFDDFLHSRDPQAPGIEVVARRTGRRSFLTFGEGFAIDKPFEDTQAQRIESYMTGSRGQALMPGMLNFPLYGALNDVFARGRPTAELAHRIGATLKLHARPHWMPTFIDNHDVDRFLAGGSVAGLKQALLAMMTLPGIPVIYYGTEQGFTESRAAMFAAGFASGGRDRYDTGAPLYRYIAELSALRRAQRAFTRGTPVLLKDNAAAAGAVVWRMAHEGESFIVALNSADTETLADNLETGAAAGTVLEAVYGIEGRPADLVAGTGGLSSVRLPARAGAVWRVSARREASAAAAPAITLNALPAGPMTADFDLSGSAPAAQALRIVVNGDIAAAQTVLADVDGRWRARIDTSRLADSRLGHRVVAWDEHRGTASPEGTFRVARDWVLLAEQADAADDDTGPGGRYQPPLGAGYLEEHPMDLRQLRVSTAGGALKFDLTMAGISTLWSPPNGFDHVVFTIYIELPGQPGGATVMPLQNASLPAGMRWHRRLRVHGWANALFGPETASATSEGSAVTPAATIGVDRAARTISLVLPAAALGAASLAGAKVYVSTWDYDSGYRPIAAERQTHAFGGGSTADPKVMDDMPVLQLP